MKNLLLLMLIALTFVSCSKETPFDHLDVLNITMDKGKSTVILDEKHISLQEGQRLSVTRDNYRSISFICVESCKINVNGALYYKSFTLK